MKAYFRLASMQNRYRRRAYSSTITIVSTSTSTTTWGKTTHTLCASMESVVDNHRAGSEASFIKKTPSLTDMSRVSGEAVKDVELGDNGCADRAEAHWGQFVDVEKISTHVERRRHASYERRLQNRYLQWDAGMEKIDEEDGEYGWGLGWVWSGLATYIGDVFAQNKYAHRVVGVARTVPPQMYVIAMSCVGVAIVCI